MFERGSLYPPSDKSFSWDIFFLLVLIPVLALVVVLFLFPALSSVLFGDFFLRFLLVLEFGNGDEREGAFIKVVFFLVLRFKRKF